jgi:hypothetical protein
VLVAICFLIKTSLLSLGYSLSLAAAHLDSTLHCQKTTFISNFQEEAALFWKRDDPACTGKLVSPQLFTAHQQRPANEFPKHIEAAFFI